MFLSQALFYLLLVLLPTQIGLHFWPDWAMVLGRRVDYLSPTLYLTDILVFFIIIFWFIHSHPWSLGSELRSMGKSIIHNTPTIILFLFIGANIYFSASPLVALYKWLKVLEFFLLGWYIVKTKPKLPLVVGALSIGVLYSSVIAVAQFFLQYSVSGPLWFLGERTFTSQTPGIAQIPLCFLRELKFATTLSQLGCPLVLRAYATFPHPNVLAGFIAVVLPLLVFAPSKIKIVNIMKLVTAPLALIALFFTFSRSAWVATAFGLGITYYELREKKYLLPIILTAATIILLITSMIDFQEESFVVRSQLNTAAMSMAVRSPLLGVGLGNFLVELPKNLVSRQIYFLQPVHNIYLLVLAEGGLVGFVLFDWLLLRSLRNNGKGQNVFKTGIRTSLFIILFLGLVDHYPLTLQQGQLLFTILLALSFIP